jgi:hypothetical protein
LLLLFAHLLFAHSLLSLTHCSHSLTALTHCSALTAFTHSLTFPTQSINSKSQKGLSEYSQASGVAIADIRFESQWSRGWAQLAFSEQSKHLVFPKKLLFRDFAYKHPLPVLNLRNWTVCRGVFEVIGRECPEARELVLDKCIGLTEECFGHIRGHKNLRKLSLAGIVDCRISPMIAEVFGSFAHLVSLNLTDCDATSTVFQTISQTCSSLHELQLARCGGLDDFAMR